jgi:hypothetical protein
MQTSGRDCRRVCGATTLGSPGRREIPPARVVVSRIKNFVGSLEFFHGAEAFTASRENRINECLLDLD